MPVKGPDMLIFNNTYQYQWQDHVQICRDKYEHSYHIRNLRALYSLCGSPVATCYLPFSDWGITDNKFCKECEERSKKKL